MRSKMPQATRSDNHRTYRCYRRGPDGVSWVFALRTWGVQNIDRHRGSVNAKHHESTATTRHFQLSDHSRQAPSMCSNSSSPPGMRRTETASKRYARAGNSLRATHILAAREIARRFLQVIDSKGCP